MYKLENLIGHIRSSSRSKKRTRTKVSQIPLIFPSLFSIIMRYWLKCLFAMYWTLCAYCEIISLLKISYKGRRKFMFDVGPLCSPLHIAARLWILFYGSKYFRGILRHREGAKKRSKKRLLNLKRFLLGPWCLIKTKDIARSFSELVHWPIWAAFCLLAISNVVDDRLNSHIAFKLCLNIHITLLRFLLAWRFTAERSTKRIQVRTVLASQINYNKAFGGEKSFVAKRIKSQTREISMR